MEEREAELLPVPYFHIVFTLPAAIGDIAYQNKARDLRSAVQGLGRDHAHNRRRPEAPGRQDRHHVGAAHLGLGHDASPARAHDRAGRRSLARTASAGSRARPNFFLPVLVLSKLFRRLMLEKLVAAHKAGKLTFFGEHAHLADDEGLRRLPGAAEEDAVVRLLQAPLRRAEGCARLPVALHPPRRHLEPAADRSRRRAVSPSRSRTTASKGQAATRR